LVVTAGEGDGGRREEVREGGKEGGGDAGLVVGLKEGEEEAFEVEEPGEGTRAGAAARELFAEKSKGAEMPVKDLKGGKEGGRKGGRVRCEGRWDCVADLKRIYSHNVCFSIFMRVVFRAFICLPITDTHSHGVPPPLAFSSSQSANTALAHPRPHMSPHHRPTRA